MKHDVFISHAHEDKSIADAICEKLESARLKCWIAARDIATDEDWTEATRRAIGSSRVVVLLLSENANAAAHIEREIAHAYLYETHYRSGPAGRDVAAAGDFFFISAIFPGLMPLIHLQKNNWKH